MSFFFPKKKLPDSSSPLMFISGVREKVKKMWTLIPWLETHGIIHFSNVPKSHFSTESRSLSLSWWQTADQASHLVPNPSNLCPGSRLSQACWSTQCISISGNKTLGYTSQEGTAKVSENDGFIVFSRITPSFKNPLLRLVGAENHNILHWTMHGFNKVVLPSLQNFCLLTGQCEFRCPHAIVKSIVTYSMYGLHNGSESESEELVILHVVLLIALYCFRKCPQACCESGYCPLPLRNLLSYPSQQWHKRTRPSF